MKFKFVAFVTLLFANCLCSSLSYDSSDKFLESDSSKPDQLLKSSYFEKKENLNQDNQNTFVLVRDLDSSQDPSSGLAGLILLFYSSVQSAAAVYA